jgi:hypothetical protein
MPIFEIVLFGAGITIGGPRAWQRLKEDLGLVQPEPEEEQQVETVDSQAAPSDALVTPRSARTYSSERRGFRDLLDDIEYLVSPRARPSKPETDGADDHNKASGYGGLGGPNGAAETTDNSPRDHAYDTLMRDNAELHGSFEDTSRDDQSLGGMWIASAINRLTARLSPRKNSIASPEPKEKVAKAVRALAGETKKYVHRGDEMKRAAACDWSPKSTPRQSAMKKLAGDSSPASTPRGGRRKIKWNEDVNVRNFIESSEELRSRREHWARILRHAERDACAAYMPNSRYGSESDEHDAVHGSNITYPSEARRDQPVHADSSFPTAEARPTSIVSSRERDAAGAASELSPWILFPSSPPRGSSSSEANYSSPPSPTGSSRPPSVPKLNLASLPTSQTVESSPQARSGGRSR